MQPRRRIARKLRIGALLLVAALSAALISPPSLQFLIRQTLVLSAKSQGVLLSIGKIEGSLFEPLVIYNLRSQFHLPTQTTISLSVDRAEANFSLRNLFFHAGVGWLERLFLEGASMQVQLASPPQQMRSAKLWPAWLAPIKTEVRRGALSFRQNSQALELRNIRFSASSSESGTVRFGEILLQQEKFKKRFTQVSGNTAIEEGRLLIANLALEKELRIEKASLDFATLSKQEIDIEFAGSAFGGKLQGQMRNGGASQPHIETTGWFSGISIAKLADFLDAKDKADGLLKEGRFSIVGWPRSFEETNGSIRLEAADFRWGKRRFDRLVLGATMLNRRIQVQEFHLGQPRNELKLTGDLAIPAPEQSWTKAAFNFNVDAEINSLSQLSALLGPALLECTGKLTLQGQLRGNDANFDGQLQLVGEAITFKKTPVEQLRASLKLAGNELQVNDLEIASKSNSVRGRGGISILGQKRYWGELKASVEDLAFYSAILRPPLVPESLAGGLAIEWSGDGTMNAHSGAFKTKLNKVRPLNSSDFRPLNAELEGTYSPENIFLSKMALGDEETRLSATVSASKGKAEFQGIRLENKGALWLEGKAVLPLDFWKLQEGLQACVIPNGPVQAELKGRDLDFQKALLLTGSSWPVKGVAAMELSTAGTLDDLQANGTLNLKDFAFRDLQGTEAGLLFKGKEMGVTSMRGKYQNWDLALSGTVNWSNRNDPALNLQVQLPDLNYQPYPWLLTKSDLVFELTGPWSKPFARGQATVRSMKSAFVPRLRDLLEPSGPKLPPLQPLAPLERAAIELRIDSAVPLQMGEGKNPSANLHLLLAGAGNSPTLSGNLELLELPTESERASLRVDKGTLFFSVPADPNIELRLSGTAAGIKVEARIFGSLSSRQSVLLSEPEYQQEELELLLRFGVLPMAPDFEEKPLFGP